MKVLMTHRLYEAIEKLPVDKIKLFVNAIDKIEDLNKTEILKLDKIVKLSKEGEKELYAYEMGEPYYALFMFRPKKTMIILDIMKMVDRDSIEFLVSTKNETDD